jgi:hypothetical protein
MYPNEGTPTTPLMQRAQHGRSSSAGLPAMDMTMQVQCRGRQGQVTLSADGTVEFTPEQVCLWAPSDLGPSFIMLRRDIQTEK